MRHILLVSVGVALAAACKNNSSESALLSGPPAQRPLLIVVHGGHNSCGGENYQEGTTQYETLPASSTTPATPATAAPAPVTPAPSAPAPAPSPDPAMELALTDQCPAPVSGEERAQLERFGEAMGGKPVDWATAPETCGIALKGDGEAPQKPGAASGDTSPGTTDTASQPPPPPPPPPAQQPRTLRRSTPLTMDMHRFMTALRTRLGEGGRTVNWIATCYSGLMADNTNNAANNLYLSWSDDAAKTYLTSRNTFWTLFRQRAEASERVYLIGHSHGGWTAMQNLLRMNVRVAGLATIDPVSLPNCGAWGYARGAAACAQFPSDVTAENRRTISGLAGWWLHFYQTRNTPASGTITEPTNSAQADQLIDVTHTEIDNNQGVWDQITTRATGAAAPAPAPAP